MTVLRDAVGDLPDAVFADLLEGDDAYLLVIDLAGATPDTVDATVEHGTLHVEARREKEVGQAFDPVSEERSSTLDVELPLPPDATGTDAEASMDGGVLELRLSKRSAATKATIPVSER